MTTGAPAAYVPTFVAPKDDWLALHAEPALEPELAIIDSHHHLWDHGHGRYLLHEILADMATGHRVLATVYVESRVMHRQDGPEEMRSLGETEFANGIAAMSASGHYGPTRVCAGIVGYADLRLGERVRPVLEAHMRAAAGRFRGVRHAVLWDEDPTLVNPKYGNRRGMLADAQYRRGIACLAAMGLSYNASLYYPQLPELTAAARALPQASIVVNHTGGPVGTGLRAHRRDEVFADWRCAMRELAACENVYVKLGGLGMPVRGFDFHTRARPPSSEELAAAWRPYIETTIELFGAQRCMFESNFPPDKASCSYAVIWNAYKRIASGASDSEKARLFSGTARAFFGLDGLE